MVEVEAWCCCPWGVCRIARRWTLDTILVALCRQGSAAAKTFKRHTAGHLNQRRVVMRSTKLALPQKPPSAPKPDALEKQLLDEVDKAAGEHCQSP